MGDPNGLDFFNDLETITHLPHIDGDYQEEEEENVGTRHAGVGNLDSNPLSKSNEKQMHDSRHGSTTDGNDLIASKTTENGNRNATMSPGEHEALEGASSYNLGQASHAKRKRGRLPKVYPNAYVCGYPERIVVLALPAQIQPGLEGNQDKPLHWASRKCRQKKVPRKI